jgi:hypothetical protein
MAFNDNELAKIRASVGALVERRQAPQHIQDQIKLELEVDGHRVRIWTIRPQWDNPDTTTRNGVAQFTYNRKRDTWVLYWMRADATWHQSDHAENTGTLAQLVRTVDDDRRGGFWG